MLYVNNSIIVVNNSIIVVSSHVLKVNTHTACFLTFYNITLFALVRLVFILIGCEDFTMVLWYYTLIICGKILLKTYILTHYKQPYNLQ